MRGCPERLGRLEARGNVSLERIDRELRGALTKLRELRPTPELQADAYRFEGAFERQLDIARDTPLVDDRSQAPPDGELDELADFAMESERAARDANRLARVVGFRVCGRR